jgi:hypothetical protein
MSLSRWKSRPEVDEETCLIKSKMEGFALGIWIAIFIHSFLFGQFWLMVIAVLMMMW